LDKILFKLKKVKKFLKGWGYNRSGNNRRRRREIESNLCELEQIEEIGNLSETQIRNRFIWKIELLTMMEEEERYWFQRCHETWLLQGDNNIEFFHRVANGRKRKQTIYSLEDGVNHITGTESILKHASDFYKQLCGPGIGNTFDIKEDMWEEEYMVTEEENRVLTRPFSEEEMKKDLFQMEKNKAAGPDGIPIEFYQSC
jgi:hypothetical protein